MKIKNSSMHQNYKTKT